MMKIRMGLMGLIAFLGSCGKPAAEKVAVPMETSPMFGKLESKAEKGDLTLTLERAAGKIGSLQKHKCRVFHAVKDGDWDAALLAEWRQLGASLRGDDDRGELTETFSEIRCSLWVVNDHCVDGAKKGPSCRTVVVEDRSVGEQVVRCPDET